MYEQTLVLLKPCCLQRGLIGEVISRFEKKGLKIVAMKMLSIEREKAEYHYDHHREKPFFEGLIDHMTSSPVIAMVLEGVNAIILTRKLTGATNVLDAEPGTIRGDYVMQTGINLVHSSDSPDSAEREIYTYFRRDEIIDYQRTYEPWIQGHASQYMQ